MKLCAAQGPRALLHYMYDAGFETGPILITYTYIMFRRHASQHLTILFATGCNCNAIPQ